MRRLRFLAIGVALGAAVLLGGCAAEPPTDSGIEGMVTVGTVSGSQAGTNGETGTAPLEAELIIKPQGGRSSVARVKSDQGGGFKVALEPGTYVIRSAGGASLSPITVQVEAGRYTRVVVPFDSVSP